MSPKKLYVKVELVGEKGGSGSGNFGHSGRPGKLGGSIPKGAGGSGAGAMMPGDLPSGMGARGAAIRALGGSTTLPAKGNAVKWDGVAGYYKITGKFTDAKLEKQLAAIEKATGKRLKRDARTNFPSFTWYQDGEESGGG